MSDIKSALEKFKQDTGVDFFDLMADPEFRKKVMEEGGELDRDEEEERREYEEFVRVAYGHILDNNSVR